MQGLHLQTLQGLNCCKDVVCERPMRACNTDACLHLYVAVTRSKLRTWMRFLCAATGVVVAHGQGDGMGRC